MLRTTRAVSTQTGTVTLVPPALAVFVKRYWVLPHGVWPVLPLNVVGIVAWYVHDCESFGASVPDVQVIVVAFVFTQPAGSGLVEILTPACRTSVTVPLPGAVPSLVTVSVYVTVPPGTVVIGLAVLLGTKCADAFTHADDVVVVPLTTTEFCTRNCPLVHGDAPCPLVVGKLAGICAAYVKVWLAPGARVFVVQVSVPVPLSVQPLGTLRIVTPDA
jgi:hypothetical protein